ncbi:Unknown protein sequence [Pseudomonas savastanoi pv. phaseolicola]|nr:Unknown protein sequence [Pseudomonas savastanoi pv. phaseolicola]
MTCCWPFIQSAETAQRVSVKRWITAKSFLRFREKIGS